MFWHLLAVEPSSSQEMFEELPNLLRSSFRILRNPGDGSRIRSQNFGKVFREPMRNFCKHATDLAYTTSTALFELLGSPEEDPISRVYHMNVHEMTQPISSLTDIMEIWEAWADCARGKWQAYSSLAIIIIFSSSSRLERYWDPACTH
jgi:hypothetical protein